MPPAPLSLAKTTESDLFARDTPLRLSEYPRTMRRVGVWRGLVDTAQLRV